MFHYLYVSLMQPILVNTTKNELNEIK